MSDRILNSLLSCPLIKGGEATKKRKEGHWDPERARVTTRSLGWGGMDVTAMPSKATKQQAAAHLPVISIWRCPAYVSRKSTDAKVLPHFYAPSLLDIHVWAHKLPVTKKSYAVHRSLHCGWQCGTNASPCAETKFCNPNGLPMGGDLEVTPITPAASSWILLLLATFTTKCRTPQLSLPSSPIRFSILWSFPLLLTPSSQQNRCPIYRKSKWVNLNESTINEWMNENRSALQKGACASVRHAPKLSQHCLKFHQGT